MSEFFENAHELSDEQLNGVAGGKKFPYGPGVDLRWNDPRCLRAVDRCRNFQHYFKECDLYTPEQVKEVNRCCDQFYVYMAAGTFDLDKAKDVVLQMSGVVAFHSMTVIAQAAWGIFLRAFAEILT